MPSLNQGRFIRQTLDSITSQKYPDLELIVVDGGSTYETLMVIKDYAHHVKWWVSEPDSGQANAINKGMAHASGEILAWLNSDDCLMPGALLRVAEHFVTVAKTDVVYGHRLLINEAGRDVGKWILPGHHKFILSFVDFIPQETLFWRAELWQRLGGGLDESLRFAMDWELLRRFIDAQACFELIPAFLGQFRMHSEQKTHANIQSDGFIEMDIIRKRYLQNISKHRFLQILYRGAQKIGFYVFLCKARLTEVIWRAGLINID